jgi:hypothetical protein
MIVQQRIAETLHPQQFAVVFCLVSHFEPPFLFIFDVLN